MNRTIRTTNRMRKMAILLFALVLVFALGGCESDSKRSEQEAAGIQGEHAVSITIACESNILLSRYDLDVYLDDELLGSLDHGTTKEFSLGLDDGTYDLCIAERGNRDVDGNLSFTIDGDSALKYRAKCTQDQVELSQVDSTTPPSSSDDLSSYRHDEVHEAFEAAGFTNIREEEVRDLAPNQRDHNWLTGTVSIAGDDDFNSTDYFFVDDEVVITYHVLADLQVPASSADLKGRSYEDVVSSFTNAGFTNVTASASSDTGQAGTVLEVRIGGFFGTADFSASDTFPFDADIEVMYYEKSPEGHANEPESVPDDELNKLLSQSGGDASWFSEAYKGKTITFDGWVGSLQNHENYTTRWDVLILAGDNGGASSDLNFRLTDVSFLDMNVVNSDALHQGDNITITAIVDDYNATAGWLELQPVSISIR